MGEKNFFEEIIVALHAHKWAGSPAKLCWIPEYYEFRWNDNIEPLIEKLKEAKEKGK